MVSPEEDEKGNSIEEDILPEERQNFAKLCRLHTELTPTVLRSLFDKFHPPSELSRILSRPEMRAKLSRLKSSGSLSQNDWQTLYSKSQSSSSQYYDCVLLMTLLQNICHLSQPYPNGWDQLPLDVDTSISADVARLNHFRTKLIKAPHSALPTSEYTKHLTSASNTLFRLTDGQCDGRVYVIDNQPLDEDVITSYVDLLRNMSSTANALRDTRRQVTSSLAGYRRPSHYFSDSPGRVSSNGHSAAHASSETNSALTKLSGRASSRLPVAKTVSSAIYATLMESLVDNKDHKDEMSIEQEVLQRYLADITANVSSDYLLQRLVQSGTLSHQERNKISLCLHHTERIRQALELVGRKAGNAFAVFCGILRGRHKTLSESIVTAKDELLNKDPPDAIYLMNQEIRVQYLATMSTLNPIAWYSEDPKPINEFYVPPYIIDKYGDERSISDIIKQSRDPNQPMRILIEGTSGAGKTALCTHLAYDWAKGEDSPIKEYKLVLFIDLTRMRNGADISDVIMQQCVPPSSQFSRQEMWAIIEANSSHVLFIIDGYEISLFDNSKFQQSSFIVTIVDRVATTSLRQCFDAYYFLLGVHHTNLPDLLDNYLNSSNTPIERYHMLLSASEDDRFVGLLRTPLYFYCACLVCETDGTVHAQTATALLQAFMNSLKHLHEGNQREDTLMTETTNSFATIIRRLELLAFRHTMNQISVFSQEELLSHCSDVVALRGLVSFYETEGSQDDSDEQLQIASFTNGALREFLAARYVSRSSHVLRKNVESLVSGVTFHVVCRHVLGLRNDNKPLVQRLCNKLTDSVIVLGTEDPNELSRFQLLLQCVNETNTDIVIPMDEPGPEDVYHCVVDNLYVIHKCENVEIARTTHMVNNHYDNHNQKHDLTHSEIVYEDVAFGNERMKIIDEEKLHNGYNKADIYTKSTRSCSMASDGEVFGAMLPEALTISNGCMPLDACALHGLACLLTTDVTHISELDVELNSMGDYQDEAVEALASAIAVNTRISKLVLRWSAAHLLARFLALSLTGNTSISQLVMLDRCRCTQYFASATVRNDLRLACDMMHHVTDVRFHGCSNAALVSALLRQIPCSMSRLSLMECHLGIVASRDLSRHVERTRTLVTLNLTRIQIKRPNFRLITDCLARNCCVNTLILNGMVLDSGDVCSLAEALRLNYTLARIDLSDTNITDTDLNALSMALRDNSSVSHLSITGCNVSDNVVSQLTETRSFKIIK